MTAVARQAQYMRDKGADNHTTSALAAAAAAADLDLLQYHQTRTKISA